MTPIRTRPSSAPALRLALLALLGGAALTAARAQQPAPTNPHGAPVLDAKGKPIVYSPTQLAAQRSLLPPAAAATAGSQGTGPAAAGQTADWLYFTLGTGIGLTGLSVSPNGTSLEVVTGCGSEGFGGNRYWCILRYQPVTQNYEQVFVSPVYSQADELRRILAVDLLPGGGREILVGTANGRIEVWDQTTRVMMRSYPSGLATVEGLCVADVDGDQNPDVLVCSAAGLSVLEANGTSKWLTTTVTGKDVVAGQMDTDAGIEIATTTGQVVDFATRVIEWAWRNGFGFTLEAADIDGDGMLEVIGAEPWAFIWSFDVDRQLPKWSIPGATGGIAAIRVGNVDADATLELLVGDAQWGDVAAFDTRTQAREWGVRNPEHGVTDIAFGDVDGDSVVEVLWGAGHTSTGQDNLFVANTQAIEWRSVHLDGPFYGPLRGDIDGDGNPEVVTVCALSGSGYSGPRILVFDGASLALRTISAPIGQSFNGATGFELVNADADAALEIGVVARSIEIYDYVAPNTFTRIWDLPSSSFPARNYYAFKVADIDGDSRLDVIAGADSFLYVYDFQTKAERYRSFSLGPQVRQVALANTDQDPGLEMLALSSQGDIYVFDAATLSADAILQYLGTPMTSFELWPLGGGLHAILGGSSAGGLSAFFYVGPRYAGIGPFPIASAAIDGITLLDPKPWFALGSGGTLSIYDAGSRVWFSQSYGEKFGTRLLVLPQARMLMSAGKYGVAGFTIP